MLQHLFAIEKKVVEEGLLYQPDIWQSLDINYHPPRVERLWMQVGDMRLSLHRIHACEESEELFHPHPWPSAMRIIKGVYEMNVGYGKGEVRPPIAATINLVPGVTYEMCDPDGWHSVRPLTPHVYTIMITGQPWERSSPKSTEPLVSLSNETKIEILNVFQELLPRAQSRG